VAIRLGEGASGSSTGAALDLGLGVGIGVGAARMQRGAAGRLGDEDEPRRRGGGGEMDGDRRRAREEEEQNWPAHGLVSAHLVHAPWGHKACACAPGEHGRVVCRHRGCGSMENFKPVTWHAVRPAKWDHY
jgi:hypothetical protein